jgi:hypothetical protein
MPFVPKNLPLADNRKLQSHIAPNAKFADLKALSVRLQCPKPVAKSSASASWTSCYLSHSSSHFGLLLGGDFDRLEIEFTCILSPPAPLFLRSDLP